jgi:hypothetical protein
MPPMSLVIVLSPGLIAKSAWEGGARASCEPHPLRRGLDEALASRNVVIGCSQKREADAESMPPQASPSLPAAHQGGLQCVRSGIVESLVMKSRSGDARDAHGSALARFGACSAVRSSTLACLALLALFAQPLRWRRPTRMTQELRVSASSWPIHARDTRPDGAQLACAMGCRAPGSIWQFCL